MILEQAALLFLPDTFPILKKNQTLSSLIASSLVFGAIFGALLASLLSDRIGRKKSMVYIQLGYVGSVLFLACSVNVYMVYVGRFFVGLAAGSTTAVVPTYVAEISPANVRGKAGTFGQFAVTLGIFNYKRMLNILSI